MSALFYVRDTRNIVGNSVMWWAWNGRGYTCDIRTAQVWTQEDLDKAKLSDHFKIYPIQDVLPLVQHHIDHQDLNCEPKRLRSWKMDDLERITK